LDIDEIMEDEEALESRLYAKDFPHVNVEPVLEPDFPLCSERLEWQSVNRALERSMLTTERGAVDLSASVAVSMVFISAPRDDGSDTSVRALQVGENTMGEEEDESWGLPTIGTPRTPAGEACILLEDIREAAVMALAGARNVSLDADATHHLMLNSWVLRRSSSNDGLSSHSFVLWWPPPLVSWTIMDEVQVPAQLFEISPGAFDPPNRPEREVVRPCDMGVFGYCAESFFDCRGGTAIWKYLASSVGGRGRGGGVPTQEQGRQHRMQVKLNQVRMHTFRSH
jgi:hypothetical protein